MLLALVLILSMGLVFGCQQINGFMSKSDIPPDKAISLLNKVETFYPMMEQTVAKYEEENPTAITPTNWEKLKAANLLFKSSYLASKAAIQDIIKLKKGQPVTLNDLSSELNIFAGKYQEFKKAFKILTEGKIIVVFPDDKEIVPNITEDIKALTPEAPATVSAPVTPG